MGEGGADHPRADDDRAHRRRLALRGGALVDFVAAFLVAFLAAGRARFAVTWA